MLNEYLHEFFLIFSFFDVHCDKQNYYIKEYKLFLVLEIYCCVSLCETIAGEAVNIISHFKHFISSLFFFSPNQNDSIIYFALLLERSPAPILSVACLCLINLQPDCLSYLQPTDAFNAYLFDQYNKQQQQKTEQKITSSSSLKRQNYHFWQRQNYHFWETVLRKSREFSGVRQSGHESWLYCLETV